MAEGASVWTLGKDARQEVCACADAKGATQKRCVLRRGTRGSCTSRDCDKQAQGTSDHAALRVTLMSQGGGEGISESLVTPPPIGTELSGVSLQEKVAQPCTRSRKFHECGLPLWFPFTRTQTGWEEKLERRRSRTLADRGLRGQGSVSFQKLGVLSEK